MVNIARQWIGTPFLSGGITKYGCDCMGLIIGVLKERGVNINPQEYFELGQYNHLNNQFVIESISKYCHKIEKIDLHAGDIANISGPTNTAHFAIISGLEPFSIIHAHQSVGKVVEVSCNALFNKKVLYGFRLNSDYLKINNSTID